MLLDTIFHYQKGMYQHGRYHKNCIKEFIKIIKKTQKNQSCKFNGGPDMLVGDSVSAAKEILV